MTESCHFRLIRSTCNIFLLHSMLKSTAAIGRATLNYPSLVCEKAGTTVLEKVEPYTFLIP